MLTKSQLLSVLSFLLISACSGNNDHAKGTQDTQTSKDHLWKEQTDTIENAKQVDKLIQDAAQHQRRSIEDQER